MAFYCVKLYSLAKCWCKEIRRKSEEKCNGKAFYSRVLDLDCLFPCHSLLSTHCDLFALKESILLPLVSLVQMNVQQTGDKLTTVEHDLRKLLNGNASA